MCGILITEDLSKAELLRHRGIEMHYVMDGDKHLVHHRLPIQTVIGDSLHQPINVAPHLYLLFNGEIFNYDREQFGSDVEYLINFFGRNASYNKIIQPDALREMNDWDGFWSIVLYDKWHQTYTVFTDPLGKKQLYYNYKGEICSEITPLISPFSEWDEVYRSQVSKWGYNTNERTPYQNIKRFKPNCIYKFNPRDPKKIEMHEDYYNIGPVASDNPLRFVQDELYRSVESRLISKTYDIGFLLSGGLDSTILLSILLEIGANVEVFTIENEEDEYVKECERYYGIKVRRLQYKIDDDIMSKVYRWSETPIDLGSVLPQFNLFGSIDHRIVLSGDGADELFGGYRRIYEYDSQMSDIFDELTYYHLPRLDRASMRYTIELRNPYLSHPLVRFAQGLPYSVRMGKTILKGGFSGQIPEKILNRKKLPLKNPEIVADKRAYQKRVREIFYA